jgi:uncharacterized protein (TIGR03067 family)
MMRLPFAVPLLLATTAAADDAAAKKFLKELEGNYAPVSMTRSGEPAPDEFIKTVTFAIKGDTLTIHFKKSDKSDEHTATLTVDPGQSPAAIDMTPKDGPNAGKAMLGIGKVEKDTVTLCWGDEAGKAVRPKEFSSTKENKQFLILMKKK